MSQWDLTIETAWTCESNESWFTNVQGSRPGTSHTVSWERLYGKEARAQGAQFGYRCTCVGFDYRKTCSHVTQVAAASAHHCRWNAALDPGLPPDRDDQGNPVCPDCGGPVVPVRVAV